MDKKEIMERIQRGRAFMHMPIEDDPDYKTDQYSGVKQPPLFKDPVSDQIIDLPTDFEQLNLSGNFLDVINARSSHRVFTQENISLLQLSYLLWCTQGVKGLRGKRYATLRTVPCGGARHEFETYLCIQYVEGLKSGYYHYLPQAHQLECLKEEDNVKDFISVTEQKQDWACKASVVFYYSMVAYRAEWRYGIFTHRVALIDAGYVSENLYLACTSIGLGSCAIGAISEKEANEAFGLDGNEEFIFLSHPVGTIQESDKQKELDFYAFVHDYDD